MKTLKLLLQIASVAMIAVGYTACGSDDSDDDGCVSCTLSYGGQTYTEEVCEADFDTTAEYNQYIAAIELLGGNCN
jgi:hypothetical protein